MSEWLSYAHDENGKPVVVDFNSELDDPEFRQENAHCISLTIGGFDRDADGLPTDGADDALYALEQRLEELLDDRDGALAVTIATQGTYAFIAYAGADYGELCAAAARDAGFTVVESSVQSDPIWSAYDRWALHGAELEDARDRSQLDELEAAGDDLSAEHEIFFDFEFPDAERAKAAEAAFGQEAVDYGERVEEDTEVQVRFVAVPTEDALRAERTRLTATAAKFGGIYQGWGSEPVEEANA